MALFVLWWCFDDHLAKALDTPGLGHLPIWVVALMALSITMTVNVGHRRR
jgi:hypothetical protein